MLSWMLYAIVVSLLIGLAALALERSAHVRRKPARFLWSMGIIASLVIPFTASSDPVQIPELTSVTAPATSDKISAPHWRAALGSTGLISGAMVTPGLHTVLLDEDEAVSGLVLP